MKNLKLAKQPEYETNTGLSNEPSIAKDFVNMEPAQAGNESGQDRAPSNKISDCAAVTAGQPDGSAVQCGEALGESGVAAEETNGSERRMSAELPEDGYQGGGQPAGTDNASETGRFAVKRTKGGWVFQTESLSLELRDLTRKSGDFAGTLKVTRGGVSDEPKRNQKLSGFKGAGELAADFQAELARIFDRDFHSLDLTGLITVYPLSLDKAGVVKALAHRLDAAREEDDCISDVAGSLGPKVLDEVLREANALANARIDTSTRLQKMRIAQFFHPANDDAFMYYTDIRKDADGARKVPCLLSSRKKTIRLDLFRRKEAGSLLLVNGKYELPGEILDPVGEMEDISLDREWVEKYMAGKVQAEEFEIGRIAAEIEATVRKFYYHRDERAYKVLALWIYGTYCYELTKAYPYLYLNGTKGSGKSTLNQVLRMTCFNPVYAVNLTGPAIFRTITENGGTMILDEMENIRNRGRSRDSDTTTILKAGYEDGAWLLRNVPAKSSGFSLARFNVYGPKVITNIFGIDDVIGDRCIIVKSFEAPPGVRLEDPRQYCREHQGELKALTSRCCLSALENFQEIYCSLEAERFAGSTARLSQLMRPLAAIAKLAGEEYAEALNGYYQDVMLAAKEDADAMTPEGMIARLVKQVAMELRGEAEKDLTITEGRPYRARIESDGNTFAVSDLHLKFWMEECLPDESVKLRDIRKWLPLSVECAARKRTKSDVSNLSLKTERNGSGRLNHYKYTFKFVDFAPDRKAGEAKAARSLAG